MNMALEVDLREGISINIKILTFLGVLPKLDSNGMVLHFFHVSITGLICISIIIAQLVNWVMSLNKDIQEIVTATFITAANSFTFVKACLVYKHQNQLMNLINALNREEFKPKNSQQCNILRRYIRQARMLPAILLGSIVTCAIFFAGYPFAAEDGPFLPSPAYVPYNIDVSPQFEITFALEVTGLCISAFCSLSIDALISGLFTLMCGQLTLLNDSLKNLDKNTENPNSNEIKSETVNEIMNINLIKCVNQHRSILQFVNDVQSIFSVAAFGQIFVSLLILCTTLFELSLVGLDFSFGYIIMYQICMLFEIFLPCYWGNEVTNEHKKITNSAYNCKWIEADSVFKKKLLYFMTISQKDLNIYAGGFVPLCNETFVTVLKSSVSYYTVLSQMNSKQE